MGSNLKTPYPIHARERGEDKLVIAQFNPSNQLIMGELIIFWIPVIIVMPSTENLINKHHINLNFHLCKYTLLKANTTQVVFFWDEWFEREEEIGRIRR